MVDPLKLTFLMCSRLCHDMAAPLSAISIGLDMLPQTHDPDTPQELLKNSVKDAINKLELLRCLAGFSPSSEKPTFTEAVHIINRSINQNKHQITWLCQMNDTFSGNAVRLLMAIILIAIDSLPRGGKIIIHPDFSVEVTGSYVKLHEEISLALTSPASLETLTSRGIIGYIACILSQQLQTTTMYDFPQPNHLVFKFG